MATKTTKKPVKNRKATIAKTNKVVASKKGFSFSPKQKLLLIVGSVIALAGVAYAAFAAYDDYTASAYTCVQRLRSKGSSSVCVKYLIDMANTRVKPGLSPGTYFGSKTESHIKAFQGRGGDGIVGPNTWRGLCNSAYTTKKAGSSYALAGCTNLLRKPHPATIRTEAGCNKYGKAFGYRWAGGKTGCTKGRGATRAVPTAGSIKDQATCQKWQYDWIPAKNGHGTYCIAKRPAPSSLTSKGICHLYNYQWDTNLTTGKDYCH